MDAPWAKDRADRQGDGQEWDGEKDGQQIDRGAEFWAKVEDRETKDVPQAENGDEGGATEGFQTMPEAQTVGDMDRKIVRAMGVPTGGGEQGIPGAERGNPARNSQR